MDCAWGAQDIFLHFPLIYFLVIFQSSAVLPSTIWKIVKKNRAKQNWIHYYSRFGWWRYELPFWRQPGNSLVRRTGGSHFCLFWPYWAGMYHNTYLMSFQNLWIECFFNILQALCKRTLNIVEAVSAHHSDKIRFYLSKADEAGHESDR